jgi:ParB family chromosome partitioning protein
LLEPHPDHPGKFRIVDGDRRWTNSKNLVENQKKNQYRRLPAEITDRTLTEEERLRVWIYIHRQRREWDTKEKEMVAYSLVDMVGRASAANILGITVRELDKLVEVYDLSLKLTDLAEPGASITWAREIKSLNKNLLTPTVKDLIIRKVNEKEITNSKDIRKLRQILKDPVAKQEFLSPAAPSKLPKLRSALLQARKRPAYSVILSNLRIPLSITPGPHSPSSGVTHTPSASSTRQKNCCGTSRRL